jgi:limonene-1,2-epoxide hydrolase
MDPVEIVRTFCEEFGTMDLSRIEPLMHEDMVWHNVATPPFVGKKLVCTTLQELIFDDFDAVDFRITSIAADGDRVLTERVDTLVKGGVSAPIPLMGIFEIVDGLIVTWRDYVDQGLLGRYLTGEDVGDLAPVL